MKCQYELCGPVSTRAKLGITSWRLHRNPSEGRILERAMTNKISNSMVELLTRKGWIEASWVKEVAPNKVQLMINWTERGVVRMRALNGILHELNRDGGNIVGEFEALRELMRMCIREHGPDGAAEAALPHSG